MTKNKPLLLEIENISKSFGNRKILHDINFEIFKGDILGFLGFSGSGKTTLLNIISGFLKPSSGNIFYNPQDSHDDLISIYRDSFEFKSLIGFSSQKPSFYMELSIYENLWYFGTLCDVEKKLLKRNISDILDLLDLKSFKNTLGKNLSQGMKKRLDLACSLIHDPQILILDEPTSNLDFKLREEVLHYIKKINKSKGITILYVSHFLEEIESLCTKVIMINYSSKMYPDTSNLKFKFEHFITSEKKQYNLNSANLQEVQDE